MDFDIRVLKYFLAVAKQGNMTKAAQSLNITQPTLSRQIMELENNLGVKLFSRENKHLSLTDSGFLFQQRAGEIVNLADKTYRELSEQNINLGGTVSIACVESVASNFIPNAISQFSKLYPSVKYELYSADGDDIKDKIDRGYIELGILIEPVETAKYDFIRLPFSEKWGIAMRSDSPLACNNKLSISDIANLPLIIPRRSIVIDEIAKWLNMKPEELNIVASHNLPTNGLLLVQNHIGYLICVQGAISIRPTSNITFVPFYPERKTGHVLVWKKHHSISNASFKFLLFVQKFIS